MEKFINDIVRDIEESDEKGFTTDLVGYAKANIIPFGFREEEISKLKLSNIVKLLKQKNIRVLKLLRNKQLLIKEGYSASRISMSREEYELYQNL